MRTVFASNLLPSCLGCGPFNRLFSRISQGPQPMAAALQGPSTAASVRSCTPPIDEQLGIILKPGYAWTVTARTDYALQCLACANRTKFIVHVNEIWRDAHVRDREASKARQSKQSKLQTRLSRNMDPRQSAAAVLHSITLGEGSDVQNRPTSQLHGKQCLSTLAVSGLSPCFGRYDTQSEWPTSCETACPTHSVGSRVKS